MREKKGRENAEGTGKGPFCLFLLASRAPKRWAELPDILQYKEDWPHYMARKWEYSKGETAKKECGERAMCGRVLCRSANLSSLPLSCAKNVDQ